MPGQNPLVVWHENKHSRAWFDSMELPAQQDGYEDHILYIQEKLLDSQVPLLEVASQYDLLMSAGGTMGIALAEVGGPPIKRDLLGKAQQTSPQQAFAEFIDNLLDNYEDNILNHEYDQDLDVIITITVEDDNPVPESNNNGIILLKENSGGVRQDKWDALVQVGNSDWESVDAAVGTWGNGTKVALASLGRHNQFSTYHESSQPIVMEFGSSEDPDENGGVGDDYLRKHSRNYYHEKNDWWHITPHTAEDGWCKEASGRSSIYIRRLTESALDTFQNSVKYGNMVTYLREIFANKIRELEKKLGKGSEIRPINIEMINLRLGGPPDEISDGAPPSLTGNFREERKKLSFIPGVEPIHIDCELVSGADKIDVEILVGMPVKNIKSECGFRMWGNGRLFQKNFTDFETQGGAYPNWQRGTTPQSRRVSGFIKIEGNPKHIPWKGPVKWEFDPLSKFSELLQQLMSYSITRYTNTSSHLATAALNPDPQEGGHFLRLFSIAEEEEIEVEDENSVKKHEIDSAVDYSDSVNQVLEFVDDLSFEEAQVLVHNYLPEEKRIDKIIGEEEDDPVYSTTSPPNNLRKSTQALTNNSPYFQYIDRRKDDYARDENGGPLDYKTLALMIVPDAFVSEVDEQGNSVRLSSAFKGSLIERIDELIEENRVALIPPAPAPPPPPEPPVIDPIEAEFLHAMSVLEDEGIDYRRVIISYVEDLD